MQRRKSAYRTAILDLVNTRRGHLSATDVYDALRTKHPKLSLGTVYRNLSLLAQAGSLNSFRAPDGVERFEAITRPHLHFVCRICGEIYDIESEEAINSIAQATREAGHVPEISELQVSGVCSRCQSERVNYGQSSAG